MGRGQDIGKTLAAPAVAALYFAAVAMFLDLRHTFQLNPDEGINAIKALLINRDYRLYTDIWSDQPPLFTYLLRGWFALVGWEIDRGRLLVLGFAALIVFAVYDLLRATWSHRAALAAVVLLVASADFVALSVSLMIGLPSLACALLAAWALVHWERSDKLPWLAASAALMTLSLCIKLFTAFLLPALALWLWAVGWWRGRRQPWRPAVLWVLAIVGSTAGVLLAVAGTAGIEQLVATHVAARRALATYTLWRLAPTLRPDWPLILLAGLGALLILRARRWELTLLLVWAAAALVALAMHTPIWLHHYQLLLVVGCASAGVAVGDVFRPGYRQEVADRALVPLAFRLTALLALVAFAQLRTGWPTSRTAVIRTAEAAPVLALMQHFGAGTKQVVTDAPMYAFRAGLTVVPDLAVFTTKRLAAGGLTADELSAAIANLAPEQILLTRLPREMHAAVARSINTRYRLVFSADGGARVRLWVRGDVVDQLAAAAPVVR